MAADVALDKTPPDDHARSLSQAATAAAALAFGTLQATESASVTQHAVRAMWQLVTAQDPFLLKAFKAQGVSFHVPDAWVRPAPLIGDLMASSAYEAAATTRSTTSIESTMDSGLSTPVSDAICGLWEPLDESVKCDFAQPVCVSHPNKSPI